MYSIIVSSFYFFANVRTSCLYNAYTRSSRFITGTIGRIKNIFIPGFHGIFSELVIGLLLHRRIDRMEHGRLRKICWSDPVQGPNHDTQIPPSFRGPYLLIAVVETTSHGGEARCRPAQSSRPGSMTLTALEANS